MQFKETLRFLQQLSLVYQILKNLRIVVNAKFKMAFGQNLYKFDPVKACEYKNNI